MAAPAGTGAELMQMMSQLGAGIQSIVNPHYQEQQQFKAYAFQHPELLQQYAKAQKQLEKAKEAESQTIAQQTGSSIMDAVGKAMGGDLSAIGQIPEGLAQGLQKAGKIQPANALQSFDFSPKQTDQLLSAAPPEDPAKLLQDSIARNLLQAGYGKLAALETTDQSIGNILKTTVDSQTNEARIQLKIPEMTAKLEQTMTQAKIDDSKFRDQMVSVAQNMFPHMSKDEQQLFVEAIANPNYLKDIEQRRALGVQSMIAQLKGGTADFGKRLGYFLNIQDELDKLNNIRRDPKQYGKMTPNEQKYLADKVNALQGLQNALQLGGSSWTMGYSKGFMSGSLDYASPQLMTHDQLIQHAASMVHSGNWTWKDILDPKNGFTPQDQQEINQQITEQDLPLPYRLGAWAAKNGPKILHVAGKDVTSVYGGGPNTWIATLGSGLFDKLVEKLMGEQSSNSSGGQNGQ